MTCELESNTATTLTHDTATKYDLATSLIDNTGMMADTANDRITCRRTGNYVVGGMINVTGLADATRVIVYLYQNGAIYKLAASFTGVATATLYPSLTVTIPAPAAQHFELYGSWDVSGGSGTKDSLVVNSGVKPFLSVVEVPQW